MSQLANFDYTADLGVPTKGFNQLARFASNHRQRFSVGEPEGLLYEGRTLLSLEQVEGERAKWVPAETS